jgi:hypothetical protein
MTIRIKNLKTAINNAVDATNAAAGRLSPTSTATTGKTEADTFYAGEEVLAFAVVEMPPNTRIYVYCNGVNITEFCGPRTSSAQIGDPIVTNQTGSASGILYIPSGSEKYRFLVGEIVLSFSDSSTGIENSTYLTETILYNHGLNLANTEEGGTISLRKTEKIRTNPLGNTLQVNTTQLRLDPLAQTFFVDEIKYPLGIYLTGVNLFLYEKDPVYPIAIELRQMVNGVPSTTEFLSGSFVIKNSADISVYDSVTGQTPTTPFIFNYPIYLKPGEWAFCVMTKSARYSLLTAKNGDGQTVKQPFAGRLFKAQNTGNWVGDDNEDLTFVLTKAVFDTGSVTINAKSLAIPDGGLEYNRFRLLSTAAEFGDTAGVKYTIQTTAAGTRQKSDIQEVKPGQNAELTGRQVATQSGDLDLKIEITSKSKDISPMLDNQLLAAQVFKSNITEYTEQISNSELKPSNGSAQARYISKPVALASGFDSTGLEVKIDVARQIGTDVEVFCRVLARDDTSVSNGIYDKNWIKMPLVTPSEKTFCGTDVIYSTETYRILEPRLGYKVAASSAKYETFAYYQVKVVFYSNNPLYEPSLKSLSAISVI